MCVLLGTCRNLAASHTLCALRCGCCCCQAFVQTAKQIYDNIEKGVYDVKNEAHGIKLGVSAGGGGAGGGGKDGGKDNGSGGCCS